MDTVVVDMEFPVGNQQAIEQRVDYMTCNPWHLATNNVHNFLSLHNVLCYLWKMFFYGVNLATFIFGSIQIKTLEVDICLRHDETKGGIKGKTFTFQCLGEELGGFTQIVPAGAGKVTVGWSAFHRDPHNIVFDQTRHRPSIDRAYESQRLITL